MGTTKYKSRYYRIHINNFNNDYYIRENYDFYTEGVDINNNFFFQGYYYDSLILAMYIRCETNAKIDNRRALIFRPDGKLYETHVEENYIFFRDDLINEKIYFIIEVTDPKEQRYIDSLINKRIKLLNENNLIIYNQVKSNRVKMFNNLKEEITSPRDFERRTGALIDEPEFPLTRDDLMDIEEYIKSLDHKSIFERIRKNK